MTFPSAVSTMAMAAIAGALLVAAPLASASDDPPCPVWDAPGPHPSVGRRTMTISDAARNNRTLTVDVWYPALDGGEALTSYTPLLPSEGKYVALGDPNVAPPLRGDGGGAGGGHYPLLVFSHGHNGARQQSALLMEHLASWGFVVAAPDHAGNSFNDPPDVSIPFLPGDRPKDVSFVIDTMLEYFDEYHLDIEGNVGALGHSFGGWTSLAVAPDGSAGDPRVAAIMPIAPAVCFEGVISCDYLADISVPMLLLGGIDDDVTPVDPNIITAFEQTNGSPRWNVVADDAGHMSFADLCHTFDSMAALLGDEDAAFAMMGGGDLDLGKQRMRESRCETFAQVQAAMGYYAAAFFRTMLRTEEGDEGRTAAMECMEERAGTFNLTTFEVFEDPGDAEAEEAEEAEGAADTMEPALNATEGEGAASQSDTSQDTVVAEGEDTSESSSPALSIKFAGMAQLLAVVSLVHAVPM